ncbi:hypothetical protein [Halosimplex halophilum]|uniref:hypothetical protein n=1 Tax=Halosimplex halophilum TaxID=2559572 RepID=UPI0014356568|nr:hypothetical protein [Halosimplex halophilum]
MKSTKDSTTRDAKDSTTRDAKDSTTRDAKDSMDSTELHDGYASTIDSASTIVSGG